MHRQITCFLGILYQDGLISTKQLAWVYFKNRPLTLTGELKPLLGGWKDCQNDGDNHQNATGKKVHDQQEILRGCMTVEQEG